MKAQMRYFWPKLAEDNTMKILTSNHNKDTAVCSLPSVDNTFLERLPGKKTFNVSAIRARAGIINLLVGIALVSHLVYPESFTVLYLSAFLLFDMLMAVVFGLTPLSPTGILATLLSLKMRPVPTPHLPKRFAWSMGASLALVVLMLCQMGSEGIWVSIVLVVFFALSWLDAVLGFCMGCWIYSRLFDCQSCRLG
jgi:hypothetical protein